MIYCNKDYEKYISDKHYDYLFNLSPLNRATEKLRLQLEELPLHIADDDYLFGWFGFDKKIETDNLKILANYSFTDEENECLAFLDKTNCGSNLDKAHTCANYERILNHGLISYEKEIDLELENGSNNEYLLAMKSTLKNICNFSKRLADFAEEKIRNTTGDEKERLLKIKSLVCKVPYYPAESFLEALQSVWIIHFLIPMAENAWCSISLGRFDKYMYPYYIKELQNGTSEQEIKNMLYNFYKLLNSYADGACLLNIGGEYNELSKLLIECQKDFNMPGPILGARINPTTSDEIFELLIDEKLFSMGQPTFYSEEGCKQALLKKGVPACDIDIFANNSCMGIAIPGKEFNSMWGCVLNVCSVLEIVLNNGELLNGTKITEPHFEEITNLEQLYDVFKNTCKIVLSKCLDAYNIKAQKVEDYEPDVFLSIITDDCISNHKDRISGAKYHNVTVECFAMVNASDGICAIDNLVFKQKKYTIKEINEAVKNNFKGYEQIRTDILNCPKYGTNSEADDYAVAVSKALLDIIKEHDHDKHHHLPSLHTLDANVTYGKRHGASYDGRLAKAPFAKNAGPCNEVRNNEPTSLILSATKLPQYDFYGGQPIDIKFDTKMIRNQKSKIATLIKTYLLNGGLQLQVNALSSQILQDAIENPDLHNDLMVRVGGYSDYFNKFSLATKEEFVERFKQEEKA